MSRRGFFRAGGLDDGDELDDDFGDNGYDDAYDEDFGEGDDYCEPTYADEEGDDFDSYGGGGSSQRALPEPSSRSQRALPAPSSRSQTPPRRAIGGAPTSDSRRPPASRPRGQAQDAPPPRSNGGGSFPGRSRQTRSVAPQRPIVGRQPQFPRRTPQAPSADRRLASLQARYRHAAQDYAGAIMGPVGVGLALEMEEMFGPDVDMVFEYVKDQYHMWGVTNDVPAFGLKYKQHYKVVRSMASLMEDLEEEGWDRRDLIRYQPYLGNHFVAALGQALQRL